MLLGQEGLEAILRTALAEHGCSVELGTELQSFQQFDSRVDATLVKFEKPKGDVVIENATFDWDIGADGARGAVRKQLGLAFLGETRVEKFIVGDIMVEGLSPKVSPSFCVVMFIYTAVHSIGICGEMPETFCTRRLRYVIFEVLTTSVDSPFVGLKFQDCSTSALWAKTSSMMRCLRVMTPSAYA